MRTERARRWLLPVLLLATAVVAAQDWEQLGASERELLSSWQPHWEQLGERQRRQLADNARLWAGLSPEQQGHLRARLEQWRALAPAQRARLRLRHDSYLRLGDADRERIRAAFTRYRRLPADVQQALRTEFAALPLERRQAYLLGAEARTLAVLAQQVFAFVPAGERAATMDMLRDLPAEERTLLQQRAARMAPWQRDALRRALLEREAGERAAYLRGLPR